MTIETKYNIGDTVYLIRGGKVHSGRVLEIETKSEQRVLCKPVTKEYYKLNIWTDDRFWLNDLYPTKADLLNSL